MRIMQTLLSATVVIMMAVGASAETIGTVETSGVFIKDSIRIEVFDDPLIGGIACYLTLPN